MKNRLIFPLIIIVCLIACKHTETINPKVNIKGGLKGGLRYKNFNTLNNFTKSFYYQYNTEGLPVKKTLSDPAFGINAGYCTYVWNGTQLVNIICYDTSITKYQVIKESIQYDQGLVSSISYSDSDHTDYYYYDTDHNLITIINPGTPIRHYSDFVNGMPLMCIDEESPNIIKDIVNYEYDYHNNKVKTTVTVYDIYGKEILNEYYLFKYSDSIIDPLINNQFPFPLNTFIYNDFTTFETMSKRSNYKLLSMEYYSNIYCDSLTNKAETDTSKYFLIYKIEATEMIVNDSNQVLKTTYKYSSSAKCWTNADHIITEEFSYSK